ncbi:helix-turn-helix domain-containing protein [uncultured Eubacterium sp.]|uniref:helix-turn-helix domain-containing protein n=1 Tax=uncultured Eubacterium sp. TaxID=165185 RepID=UPI0025947A65|nr:helix-turn-helix transcriptional regulator [uncultured Eubacterium sp.]
MNIKIGERLKELRKSKGWTQVQVAAKMGLTDSVISFYERQERAPSPEVLIKFAELYDVSTDYLLGVEKVNDQHLDVTGLSKREITILKEFIEILRKKNS